MRGIAQDFISQCPCEIKGCPSLAVEVSVDTSHRVPESRRVSREHGRVLRVIRDGMCLSDFESDDRVVMICVGMNPNLVTAREIGSHVGLTRTHGEACVRRLRARGYVVGDQLLSPTLAGLYLCRHFVPQESIESDAA